MSKHKDYRGRPFRVDLSSLPKCSSGKRGWPTEVEVQAQLRSARWTRAQDVAAGRTPGRVEKAYYLCKACEHYHLKASEGKSRRGDFNWQHERQN